MNDREALKLALEALDNLIKKTSGQSIYSFMETERRIAMAACVGLREALAEQPLEMVEQPADEPSGPLVKGWSITFGEGHAGYGVYAHMEEYPEEGAFLLLSVEQPAQQEPVAWPCVITEADFSQETVTLTMQCTDYKVSAGTHWLYTSPPAQREWQGLTDEEIESEWSNVNYAKTWAIYRIDIVRAIEAKLKEKNT